MKKQTFIVNLISNNSETAVSFANKNVEGLLESTVHSKVTDNIFFNVSGYMIRNLVKTLFIRNVQHQWYNHQYQYLVSLLCHPFQS